MNRPVAARAAAHAAENVPHDNAIHARRVSSGDVSSASRPGIAVFTGAAATAAAPPGDATVVVLPARSGIGAAARRRAGTGTAGTGGGVSSAIGVSLPYRLRSFHRGPAINHC